MQSSFLPRINAIFINMRQYTGLFTMLTLLSSATYFCSVFLFNHLFRYHSFLYHFTLPFPIYTNTYHYYYIPISIDICATKGQICGNVIDHQEIVVTEVVGIYIMWWKMMKGGGRLLPPSTELT